MCNIFENLAIGIIAGIISGGIVYIVTKKREKKNNAKETLRFLIFEVFRKLEINIPANVLDSLDIIDDKDKEFKTAVYDIINYLFPKNLEEKLYDEDEIRQIKNAEIIMNKIGKKRKKRKQ